MTNDEFLHRARDLTMRLDAFHQDATKRGDGSPEQEQAAVLLHEAKGRVIMATRVIEEGLSVLHE
jgi:hypothetical protein